MKLEVVPAESYLLCLSLLVNLIRGLSKRVLEIPWKGNKLQQVLSNVVLLAC